MICRNIQINLVWKYVDLSSQTSGWCSVIFGASRLTPSQMLQSPAETRCIFFSSSLHTWAEEGQQPTQKKQTIQMDKMEEKAFEKETAGKGMASYLHQVGLCGIEHWAAEQEANSALRVAIDIFIEPCGRNTSLCELEVIATVWPELWLKANSSLLQGLGNTMNFKTRQPWTLQGWSCKTVSRASTFALQLHQPTWRRQTTSLQTALLLASSW